MESTSTLSGVSPSKPSSTAFAEPCPRPVAPSEPYISARMRAVDSKTPSAARDAANRRPATIGPTVCELEGPMPILNKSKTLTVISRNYKLFLTSQKIYSIPAKARITGRGGGVIIFGIERHYNCPIAEDGVRRIFFADEFF